MNIQKQLCNKSNYTEGNRSTIKYLVIHYTGNYNDTALNNCKYFQSPDRKASAHYFVDENSIYQSVLDKDIAWHCGTKGTYYHKECRNNNSIGIELCNSVNSIPAKTIENSKKLIQYLMKKYNIPKSNIVRHYDITHKQCPLPLLDNGKWKSYLETILKDEEYSMNKLKIVINGQEKEIQAINIEGNNYIKLRDLESDKINIGFTNGKPTIITK